MGCHGFFMVMSLVVRARARNRSIDLGSSSGCICLAGTEIFLTYSYGFSILDQYGTKFLLITSYYPSIHNLYTLAIL